MMQVALRKESVDRNKLYLIDQKENPGSLSARRAWIEIGCSARNSLLYTSLSARRAWIEIGMRHNVCRGFAVALRKESVDRNNVQPRKTDVPGLSLSARRAWIEIKKK